MSEPTSLEKKLAHLPEQPGVYLFKDADGNTIYIGKARILKNRVRSYFQDSSDPSLKTKILVTKIKDLEFIVTDNEIEALLLESHLVKKNQPRYNLELKDDKSFPFIKLTVQENFPRAFLTRQHRKDGALYFGPYTAAGLAKETLRLIHRHFRIRTCRKPIDGSAVRPCLNYHIGRCLGPCSKGHCRREEYRSAVEKVRLLLEGKTEVLTGELRTAMMEAAGQEKFEEAAIIREQIRTVESLAEHQKMVLNSTEDADFLGFHQEGSRAALQLFTMRGSKVLGRQEFFWEELEGFQAADFLAEVIRRHYLPASFVPSEIWIPMPVEDQSLLEEILSRKKRRPVRIQVPKIGTRRRLLRLVEKNAHLAFQQRFRVLGPTPEKILSDLQRILGLPEPPRRIECFDISNIQGTNSVASMVVCVDGVMKPSEYRKYRIRTVEGANDFASMQEAVYRRYRRLQDENRSLPGLVLVDGGKGQLSSAREALDGLNLAGQPLAALAKEEEALFLSECKEPLRLEKTDPVLHLLQQMRDEAHRFALAFHRKRRQKSTLQTALLEIPGIGPRTARKLLTRFQSLKRLQQASQEDLEKAVGPRLAQILAHHLKMVK